MQLIEEDFTGPGNETLEHFFQRRLDEGSLSTRMRSIYNNAKYHFKNNHAINPLPKPVKEIKFNDLFLVRGVGKKMWEEFVEMRGY